MLVQPWETALFSVSVPLGAPAVTAAPQRPSVCSPPGARRELGARGAPLFSQAPLPAHCLLALSFLSFHRRRAGQTQGRHCPWAHGDRAARVECGWGCWGQGRVSEPPWHPLTCFPAPLLTPERPFLAVWRVACGGEGGPGFPDLGGESLAPLWCVTAAPPPQPKVKPSSLNGHPLRVFRPSLRGAPEASPWGRSCGVPVAGSVPIGRGAGCGNS